MNCNFAAHNNTHFLELDTQPKCYQKILASRMLTVRAESRNQGSMR